MMNFLHVKWFVPNTGAPEVAFSIASPMVQVWVLIVISLLAIAFLLDKKVQGPSKKFHKAVKKHQGKLIYAFRLLVGISILSAAVQGFLLEPHFGLEDPGQRMFASILQGAAALLLIFNVRVHLAAGIIFTLFIGIASIFGPIEALDYINLIGVAAFLAFTDHKETKHLKREGLRTLTILTGLTLVVLAFSEKLLNPDLALSLLAEYDLNFMKMMGFHHFSDELFVLSTGMMELTFGAILMLGWIPRINILSLTFFFLATNTYFFCIGQFEEGMMELLGHLPVVATVIMIVAFGVGRQDEESSLK